MRLYIGDLWGRRIEMNLTQGRKMTHWGFYEPARGILPFKNDNGFNEWYYYCTDYAGDLWLSVDIIKVNERSYEWSVRDYRRRNPLIVKRITTTLRKAMIEATSASLPFIKKGN